MAIYPVIWRGDTAYMYSDYQKKEVPIGKIVDGVYLTSRDFPKHWYRNRRGFPIDVKVIEDLKKKDVKRIQINKYHRDETSGKKISDEIKEFTVDEYDKEKAFQQPGYDWQKCVPWDREIPHPDPQTKLFALSYFELQ